MERGFKALGNRRRLAILRFIKKVKEATVGDIAEEIKLSFKSTSRHLSVLAAADIVEREQRSLQAFYRLGDAIGEPVRRAVSIL
ncbi:MAG: metalloregulator ArsR/SmtB family transcription factor [bacterium]|nr:metalloregulator ArsR/SmtB family transcription factor [bacterium]